jgi:hypothetical protein
MAREGFLYREISIPNYDLMHGELIRFDAENFNDDARFSILDMRKTMAALPNISIWFESMGLKPKAICHINQEPHIRKPPHVDRGYELALNFPIRNCETSPTQIFRKKGEIITVYTPITNIPYLRYDDDDPEEIGRYVMTGPVLLNINMPHTCCHEGIGNRVCISFRFEEDPWFLAD